MRRRIRATDYEAIKAAAADAHVSEDARRACARVAKLLDPGCCPECATAEDLRDRMLASTVTARDVVDVFRRVRIAHYGGDDTRLARRGGMADAVGQAAVLVRREFGGDAVEASRYMARVVRFWKLRGEVGKWPGPAEPEFERACDARLIDAWKRGQIRRETNG